MKQELLKGWLTVEEYAKREGITRAGAHDRIGRKLIDPDDVIVFPKKIKILIKDYGENKT